MRNPVKKRITAKERIREMEQTLKRLRLEI